MSDLSPKDLATIRQIVREEIEASKPKVTLNPPRTRAEFLEDWEREQAWRRKSRRWFR